MQILLITEAVKTNLIIDAVYRSVSDGSEIGIGNTEGEGK